MKAAKSKHWGSSLDAFLKEEGIDKQARAQIDKENSARKTSAAMKEARRGGLKRYKTTAELKNFVTKTVAYAGVAAPKNVLLMGEALFPEMRRAVVRSSGVSISISSSARSFVASYVKRSVSSFTSWRNICVVVVASRSNPSLCWTRGWVTSVTWPVAEAWRSAVVSTAPPRR